MRYLAAQLVGFAAMAFCVSCYVCKDSRRLLTIQMIGNALFLLQYVLLNAYTGFAGVVILVGSSLVQVLRMQGNAAASRKEWKWAFMIASTAICGATWQDWFSILPCVGTAAFIWSNWTGDANIIRRWKVLAVGPCWIVYNLHVESYAGAASEFIGICTAVGTLLYTRIAEERGKPEKAKGENNESTSL